MSSPESLKSEHEARLAEAVRLRVRLAELGVDSTPESEAWLREPENFAAWVQVSEPWEFLDEQADAPEALAARRQALQSLRQNRMSPHPHGWHYAIGGIAAILILGILVWAGVGWLQRPADYATALGERRVVTLDDGSRVSLDSDSEVTVRYTDTARILHLLRGQARFDVAHDVERPFSVLAGGEKVIATGTAFNIDLSGNGVLVTLIEGHVVVVDEKAVSMPSRRQISLESGQQLTALAQKEPAVEHANIQRVTAWMNGQLIFDNEPLSQVVARVSRYTKVPIAIRDPQVAAMRISGVFNTGDLDGVVDTVTQYLPVRAVNENGTILLEKGSKN